jgi:hypothetical protein
MRHPRVGDVVNVLFDPKSHRVKLDASDWKHSHEQEQREARERWQEIAEAPPDAAPAGSDSETVRIVRGVRRVPPPGP